MGPLEVFLPPDQYDELRKWAAEEGYNVSHLLQIIVEEALTARRAAKRYQEREQALEELEKWRSVLSKQWETIPCHSEILREVREERF